MSKTYTILYLANSGEIIGGGQISLLGLLKGLNEKYHPIVVCPASGSFYDELSIRSIETYVIPINTLRQLNVISWIKTVIELIRIIKEKKIDLIHSNGSRVTIFGGIAARLTKTHLIWHVRIADSDKLLDRFLVLIATKIIVISKAVKKRFDWLHTDTEKIKIIYNGIDLEKFKLGINGEKVQKEFDLPDDAAVIGIVGRLDWYKGHQYFLEAAKIISEKLPNVCFLIVGDGEYRNRLEGQVKQLMLEKDVIFTGNRNDIPEILAAIDLFTLSSVSEGFGRVAAEAMACGKPVVATNIGGLSEVVEDGVTGRLVPARDPATLAEAISEILSDKGKLENMGIAGRKRVEELFSIEKNVKNIELLYEKILTNKI